MIVLLKAYPHFSGTYTWSKDCLLGKKKKETSHLKDSLKLIEDLQISVKLTY